MAETDKKQKVSLTPRQREIKQLTDKGRDKRTPEEVNRLDRLKMEEKRDKFLRLAQRRVPRAIQMIGYVANLGNQNSYNYTEDQVAKIMAALEAAVQSCSEAFSQRRKDKQLFTL